MKYKLVKKSIKKYIINKLVNIKILRLPSVKYCSMNNLLPNVFVRTSSNDLRKILNLPKSKHRTQLNQDIFALLCNRFRRGYFVEIGANDGYTLSNTIYLEENFNWNGLLIEPNPKYQNSLMKRENSIVINKAISSDKQDADFIDAGLYGGLEDTIKIRYESLRKEAKK